MASQIVSDDLAAIVHGISAEARALEGKTVLISGGSGFIGNYVVATLQHLNNTVLSRKCRVISVDNYITGSQKHLTDVDDKNFKFINHDVRQPLKISGDVHFIMHAAGIASPAFYRRFPLETLEVSIYGTKNLLELAKEKRSEAFLFFSSSEVYGDPDLRFVPTPETYRGNVSCTGPRACYDESKRLGEAMCLTYRQIYDVPIKIIRPFNVYGPGMKPDDRRVIPTLLFNALEGKPLPIYGEGTQKRTFCYVSDALIGILKVLLSGKSGDIFNVGNDSGELSMNELAAAVSELFEGKIKIQRIHNPDEVYAKEEPQRRCPDLTKIRSALGYAPAIDLKTGLTRLLDWYRTEYKLQLSS